MNVSKEHEQNLVIWYTIMLITSTEGFTIRMTELLAPAGNIERLKWAVAYGADAVYFGIEQFSLRSFAGNFTLADAQEGLQYLHNLGRKGYVTLNAYPFSEEFAGLAQAARTLDEMGADAFIVADLGVLRELRSLKLRTRFISVHRQIH